MYAFCAMVFTPRSCLDAFVVPMAVTLLGCTPPGSDAAPTSAPASTQNAAASPGAMQITRAASQARIKGAPANFIGDVEVEPLFAPNGVRNVIAANVTFSAGAHSAWHTHPSGQTLVVTAGTGWVQQWGGPKQEIKPGDVVWTPPGVKHWHGATAAESMTHMAIQEQNGGNVVEWMEHLDDETYRR